MSARLAVIAAILVTGAALVAPAGAAPIACGTDLDDPCEVSSGNAKIGYDPIDNSLDDEALSGLEQWNVGGVEHLFQQVFAIRIGDGPTLNVGNLTLGSAFADDTLDTIEVQYATGTGDSLVTIGLSLLLGSAPGIASAIDIEIDIEAGVNLVGIPISFFMYTDLDLGESSDDDTGITDGAVLTQVDATTRSRVGTTTKTSGFDVATLGVGGSALFNAIVDGTLDSLGFQTGPLTGDVHHAFQWTFTPSDNQLTFEIRARDEILPVPAPAPLGLLGLGLVGLGLARRMRAA